MFTSPLGSPLRGRRAQRALENVQRENQRQLGVEDSSLYTLGPQFPPYKERWGAKRDWVHCWFGQKAHMMR